MRSQSTQILFSLLFSCYLVNSAILPSGFAELRLADRLDGTSMKYSPDGRVFIVQKPGIINIIKEGSTEKLVCMDIQNKVDNFNERGVQSIAFDPDFPTNGYIYIYYSVLHENRNRVSRFTVTGDVCDINSEVVIIDLDTLAGTNHNGGAMWFQNDQLFITTGDGVSLYNAQSLDSVLGKVLRLNKDGTIPPDNPYYQNTTGDNRAIYALGFRNPQAAALDPVTGRVFINDVGQNMWEEVNELVAGGNYGWPEIEGNITNQTAPENYKDPVYSYSHADGGCAIVGAAWYNPTTVTFPEEYVGKYFFGDYCTNAIYVLDPDTWTILDNFAAGVVGAVSFDVSPAGDFYYLSRGGIGYTAAINTRQTNGEVYRVQFTNSNVPTFSYQPSSILTTEGRDAIFSVGASGGQPLSYQWYRDGTAIADAISNVYTVTAPTFAENDEIFQVTVTNSEGSIQSEQAVLTVVTNTPPTPVITTPTEGQTYDAGTWLDFSGTATDNEDGVLYGDSFAWKIDFYHDGQVTPGLEFRNAMAGSYFLPSVIDTSSDVFYRVSLIVSDFSGTSSLVYTDVYPNTVTVSLDTSPPGLTVKLDGLDVITPYSFVGVVGVIRTIEASSQISNGANYEFQSWSNNGTAQQNLTTPSSDQTITATFAVQEAISGNM